MYQYLDEKQKNQLFRSVLGLIGLASIFLLVLIISNIKSFGYIGSGVPVTNTITVTGMGDVMAVPDIATVSFSVTQNAKQMADAQDAASKKINSVVDALKGLGIDAKDIQTTNYSSYPQYEYQNASCPRSVEPMIGSADGSTASPNVIYCPPGKSVLTGYEVSQTVTVKIRKTDTVGNILAKIGTLGVSNISGPDFTVDNMDAVQAEARDKAIADAKAKAAVLSKSLGVSLNHIVNFYESGATPLPYAMDSMNKAMGAGVSAPTMPQIPTGQNKITSTVSITYEVR